jgi:hypothetical protein
MVGAGAPGGVRLPCAKSCVTGESARRIAARARRGDLIIIGDQGWSGFEATTRINLFEEPGQEITLVVVAPASGAKVARAELDQRMGCVSNESVVSIR